jgi:hypothetical protein
MLVPIHAMVSTKAWRMPDGLHFFLSLQDILIDVAERGEQMLRMIPTSLDNWRRSDFFHSWEGQPRHVKFNGALGATSYTEPMISSNSPYLPLRKVVSWRGSALSLRN